MTDGIRDELKEQLLEAAHAWAIGRRAAITTRMLVEELDRLIETELTSPAQERSGKGKQLMKDRREAVHRMLWWGEEEQRRLHNLQTIALAATEQG